jgi:hypothetical protein
MRYGAEASRKAGLKPLALHKPPRSGEISGKQIGWIEIAPKWDFPTPGVIRSDRRNFDYSALPGGTL